MAASPAEPVVHDVIAGVARVRAARDAEILAVGRIAASIADTCRQLCSAKATVAAIAERLGWPVSSLPIHLLCEPWSERERVAAFGQSLQPRRELIGFFLPGNLPGAGLHEIAAALLSGCALMVKTASQEPLFFAAFARVLMQVDPAVGARVAVFNWSRERAELTAAMNANCDRIVVYGEDETIAKFADQDDCAGFGARVSGIVIAGKGGNNASLIETIAHEVAYFEQRGCLSPHHVLIDADNDVRDWARRLAQSLGALAQGSSPAPRTIALASAAAIRRVRETARWRALGGDPVELWEGPIPGWTVVYDRDASFTVSPGFRTVYVSPFPDAADLKRRLATVSGRLETMGLALTNALEGAKGSAIREVIERSGASWICEPGRMQAPPVDWPHGSGAFIRTLRGAS